jgi:hypothetical protein
MKTLGIGLGLRSEHFSHVLQTRPAVSWFEALSENYMGLDGRSAGRPLQILQNIRRDYPIVLHGVSLSIGSVDELDFAYLENLKNLAACVQPEWISDHLCWTGVEGENLHDLLPLPYTEECLEHLIPRVHRVQEILGRPLVLENPSAYLSFRHSHLTEWDFLNELGNRTGCGFLLDVNNVYVSSINFGFDPMDYLRAIDKRRITQIHLAGHSSAGDFLIDTHDHPVADPVWRLYRESVRLWGKIPAMIEWDDKIPEFEVLQQEADKARMIQEAVLAERESHFELG